MQTMRLTDIRAILETALDCIVCIDEDSSIIEFNAAAEKTFGFTRQEALGNPLHELIIPMEYREAHRLGMQKYLLTGEGPVLNQRFEITALTKDNREIPIELVITPFELNGARIFIGYIRDLTEVKRLQGLQEVSERDRVALEKMQVVSQLAAGLAHDLNNILTVIVGNGRALVTDNLPAEELALIGEDIYSEGLKAAALTKSLLDFSSQSDLVPQHEDVNQVLRAYCGEILEGLPPGVTVDLDLQPSLPTIWVDHNYLARNLDALVQNAIDAIAGEGVIRISTRLREVADLETTYKTKFKDQFIELVVLDNGRGISEEIMPRVFEPFFTTKIFGLGAGLGLARLYGFVDQIGGTVDIQSQHDQGTRVTLGLPISVEDVA